MARCKEKKSAFPLLLFICLPARPPKFTRLTRFQCNRKFYKTNCTQPNLRSGWPHLFLSIQFYISRSGYRRINAHMEVENLVQGLTTILIFTYLITQPTSSNNRVVWKINTAYHLQCKKSKSAISIINWRKITSLLNLDYFFFINVKNV